jgi:recombination protein RecA
MTKTITDLLGSIAKQHGLTVGSVADVIQPVEGLSTGNLAVDYVTGVGGMPRGRITELYGLPSSGKAQPYDALVLTPDGYIKMGEVREGDVLTSASGQWTRVTGVHPQGVQPVYRLTFSDGSACEASADHLWSVEVWVQSFGYLAVTATTAQLRRRIESSSGRPRVRLPSKLKPIAAGLHTNRDLVSVEYVRDAECQCITVDAPDRLYVTNDFIPTHNSTTALQCAATLQTKIISEGRDEHILYLDFEKSIDADYCTALGLTVDHPSFLIAQPSYLEQAGEAATELIATGKIPLMIVDSVAAMAPKTVIDGGFDRRTAAMERARLLSGWLLRLSGQLSETNACAVFINHLTEAIELGYRPGHLPPQETTPGGKGLKYYASLRLRYQQTTAVKGLFADFLTGTDERRQHATQTRVKVTKNKVGIPFREAEVRVRFGHGFDNAWSAVRVLRAHKIIKVAGAWHTIDVSRAPQLRTVEQTRFQGEQTLLDFAEERPQWRARLIDCAERLIQDHGGAVLETGDLTPGPVLEDLADEPTDEVFDESTEESTAEDE